MQVQCFSSFTFSYLNRARVLFSSLRKFHPNWHLVALITDEPPAGFTFDPATEPFDAVVYAKNMGIELFDSWIFRHDVVEACTAVKGPYIERACASGADAVIYLDPDTCLFGSLDPIERLLEEFDIILTPHTTIPETTRNGVMDNEIGSLKTGVYNLGFCAIRTSGEGARFAQWWRDRLLSFCYNDIPSGLFTDQRWCDLVPALFEKVKVLRDPGYNVASWNVGGRRIAVEKDGSITANGNILRFWHFTKLGSVADIMTKRYAKDNFPVYEIWNWYKRQVAAVTEKSIPEKYWHYAAYDDGVPIDKKHRVLYRSDPKLPRMFSRPFCVGSGSFIEWLRAEGHADMATALAG